MKNKRRILGIAVGFALVVSLLFSGVALADDPTHVDVNWDGAGAVTGSVTAGDDATALFGSAGSHHIGEFHAVDNNDNPYTYGVDSCTFSLDTSITPVMGWQDRSPIPMSRRTTVMPHCRTSRPPTMRL